MQKAQGKLIRFYYAKGLDFYITSIEESNHQPGSFHYIGDALDFKCQDVPLFEIKELLGVDFDVVENEGLDIFHVEYDSHA